MNNLTDNIQGINDATAKEVNRRIRYLWFMFNMASFKMHIRSFFRRKRKPVYRMTKQEALRDNAVIDALMLAVENGACSNNAIRLKLFECGFYISFLQLDKTIEILLERNIIEINDKRITLKKVQ